MAAGRTRTVLVTRWEDGEARRVPDQLVVEEPMTVQLDGRVVTTTMRTPGNDFELAAGFCFTDGLLAGAPVTGVRYCATGSPLDTGFNVVTVETGGRAPEPEPRLVTTTSSCGVCGSTAIDALVDRLAPLRPGPRAPRVGQLADAAGRLAHALPLFGATGAVHAAVAFDDDGAPVVAREDVGRHNAVDKVIGRLLLDGALPARGLALFVTSRASVEIVAKAWAAGFPSLVAVSAPTSLAVEAAQRAGMTLVGFVREGRANLYSTARSLSSDVTAVT